MTTRRYDEEEVREIFSLATTGSGLRDWSHGDLHVSIEPTGHGEQLRLSHLETDGVALNGLGAGLGGMSVLMSAVVAAVGNPTKALAVLGMFGGMAVAAFGVDLVRRVP